MSDLLPKDAYLRSREAIEAGREGEPDDPSWNDLAAVSDGQTREAAQARFIVTTRGLVIAPRFTWDGTTLHFPGSVGIEASDLRHYLLYWDRLDWPDTNLIRIAGGPDTEFLANEGILTRTEVRASGGGSLETGYIIAQLFAFEQLDKQNPGQWSLGQAANTFLDPRPSGSLHRTIEVELYAALPAPPDNISLADVLAFKQKRQSELLALRQVLDELYLQITSSGDVPRAKDAAIACIENALIALDRVVAESWPSRIRRSMKVEVKLPELVKLAIAGGVAASALGLPVMLGAAGGSLAASIKIEAKSLRGPSIPEKLRDFAYLFHLPRELR